VRRQTRIKARISNARLTVHLQANTFTGSDQNQLAMGTLTFTNK